MRLTRLLTASALMATAALAAAMPAGASTPASSGTITPKTTPGVVTATWTGNIAGANANNDCSKSVNDGLNDHHTFTLAVPAGFYDTNDLNLTVTTTAAAADAILTTYKGTAVLGSSDNGGVGGSETYAATNPDAGVFDAVTCSFAGASPYTASVTLTTSTKVVSSGIGGESTTAAASSYVNNSLQAVSGDNNSGEPSIGVDWKTGNVYFQSYTTTVKAVYPTGAGAPALSDATCLSNSVLSLDPILFTDSITGRTGSSQLLVNPVLLNSNTTFFDAAADPTASQANCKPSNGGGAAAGPDHQTLGGGTYPKTLGTGVVGPETAYPRAFYYCSQTIVSGAICSRSDNGGTVFNDSGVPYTAECGGLHGHVRVGPEGNVLLPNKSCGGTQGLAISKDAGRTWSVKSVTGSTAGATDPSTAADRAGNVFFGYVNGDGTPAVSVSSNAGNSWSSPVKVGEAAGIKNATWAEVIAGDSGRAAMAFLGTTTGGNRNQLGFGTNGPDATTRGTDYTGAEWHMYVATTVDRGASWKTVDITPTDPVQRGSICTDGTTCSSRPNTRNLLDFNDITVDKTGRVLVGYADGCINACVTSTKVADNKLNARGTIARQVDGPLLFSSDAIVAPPTVDPVVPEVPIPVLLPLAALGVLTGAALVRRRRTRAVA